MHVLQNVKKECQKVSGYVWEIARFFIYLC